VIPEGMVSQYYRRHLVMRMRPPWHSACISHGTSAARRLGPPSANPAMISDVRFALRQLAKSPGFTAVAVATLAIGIGANTAIFSAIDAVLLRPQPYPEPDRLVVVFERGPNGGRAGVSGGAFRDWRDHQTKFDALMFYGVNRYDLTGLGEPEKIHALSVSSGFNRVLGVPPLLGQGFTADNDRVGGLNNVVMLTERFWRSRFSASPSALGRQLVLDGRPYAIIGVMPDRAWFQPRFQPQVDVYTPEVLVPNTFLTDYDVHRASALGRLAPGATVASAQAELNAIKKGLDASYPVLMRTWSVALQPLQQGLAEDSRPVLLLLFAAVGVVLLIACANVANLLLARASTRRREMAVRAALGASGGRLVRQVLTESLLLSLVGGVCGIVLAAWSIDLLAALSSRLLPSTMAPTLDGRVLAFSLVASCGTGLLFGAFPAWRMRRPDLIHALKSGTSQTTDRGRSRSQSTLVVAEIALTGVLLVCTGLLVRAMVASVTADPGYKPANVLMFDLTMPFREPYQGAEERMAFLARAAQEIRGAPGVVSVATTDNIPFGDNRMSVFYSLEERPETRQDRAGDIKFISQGYFETLGTTLLRGRTISAQDNRVGGPRVLVVNQSLATGLFGGEDPIGRHLNVDMDHQSWEIVGVAADMRVDELHAPPRPTFFEPHAFFPWSSAFIVRTRGDALAATRVVAAAIHRIDPNIPLANPHTLESAMNHALGPQKLILNLIAAFAATALVLASIGLYGVMSYSVATRERELSIRTALGAARRDLMRLVFGRGMRLTVVGLALGLLGGLAVARFLASEIHGVSGHDPLVFAGAAIVLSGVALAACLVPARRAMRVDPVVALRAE
jgi:predicted permease